MLKLSYRDPKKADATEDLITTKTELVLLNENNHPTPLAVGLVALELAFDVAVAVGAFNLMKAFTKRK